MDEALESLKRGSSPESGADSLSPVTLAVSILVLPFLVVASVLLYLAPGHTEQHFAWTIAPPVTALYLGSAYIGGIWFFAGVLRTRSWVAVRRGFPAVLTFATLLGIATLLHWEKFHAGHLSFVAWATLYLTTPVLLALVLVLQSRRAHSRPTDVVAEETVIPRGWCRALAALGAASLTVGSVLFLVPAIGVDTWAWQLTPLTARVIGATLTLPGAVNLWLLVDPRWSAFRVIFQAQLVSLSFILLGIILSWAQLDFSRIAAWALVPGLAATLALYAVFYRRCEKDARRKLPGTDPAVNPRAA
ncbi:putative membrane protein [Okibacterium sp. HSC-33S16]|uniref:hypothetical protein n=1 Tax=Okibacterium sp. HSC-33S16 TaxID=2910965 RepID=UPI00209E0E87|nr:hypothetical protein [Okibacterium sp. HSC-33S16]MCP2032704.1 putative membrane protein [Okibacterium sp. HSC-33S16]